MAREASVAAPVVLKNKRGQVNRRTDVATESANGFRNYASGGAPFVPMVQSPDLGDRQWTIRRRSCANTRNTDSAWKRIVGTVKKSIDTMVFT